MGQADAPDHQHGDQDGDEDEGAPQVGLQEHEHRGHEHVDDAQEDEAQAVPQRRPFRQHSGKRHDQHQLGQLRGLQPEERQLDPAVCPDCLAAAPDKERGDQQKQRGQVYVAAPAGEPAVVGDADHQEKDDPDDEPYPLGPHVVEGVEMFVSAWVAE